jgi:hypothetical protein
MVHDQHPVAIGFGIDIGYLDVKHNRQHHNDRNRQPGAENVNGTEQLLLPYQVPGLLKI